MNEHDLFRAIGHADDAFLQEIDQPKNRRLPRHFGLIVAVLALVLTACAAPVVVRSFDKVKGGEIVASDQDIVIRTNTVYSVSKTVSLEVAVDPDAPDTIAEYWLPLKLLEYCNVEGYTQTDTALTVSFSMDTTRNRRVYDILYHQQVLPSDGSFEVEGVLKAGIWQQCENTYGDISVTEFYGRAAASAVDMVSGQLCVGKDTFNAAVRHIFWSDGMYLYCLRLVMSPPVYQSKVEQIVTSLAPVEDITQYLPAQDANE